MITLLVKAPDQQIDDQIVKCELDWTVEKLKDHLEIVHPNKPKRCEQKIIFSGQVLNDSMILQDIFQQYNQNNETDNTLTVHLVCSMKLKASQSLDNTQLSGNNVNTPDVSIIQTPTAQQQYYGQLNNQQMAWMQQAYAHYLTQYMQLMAAQGIPLQSTIPYSQSANSHQTDTSSTSANPLNNNINRDDNDERRVAGPELADALGNPQNNNNNGAEDGEVGLNRDWLDVFDVLARVVVLSSIVYFYSSPSRFLIVTFLGFAIYLIQGGFFRGQPMFMNDNNNGRMENNNNGGNDNNAGQPADPVQPRNQQQNNDETHQELRATNPQEENERPGAWAFTWTFFSSFFASLIPEQPPVI